MNLDIKWHLYMKTARGRFVGKSFTDLSVHTCWRGHPLAEIFWLKSVCYYMIHMICPSKNVVNGGDWLFD